LSISAAKSFAPPLNITPHLAGQRFSWRVKYWRDMVRDTNILTKFQSQTKTMTKFRAATHARNELA
jgi:hypothetical protein